MPQTTLLKVIHPIHEDSKSLLPFVHALKIVLASGGELEIIDIRDKNKNFEDVGVRKILEKWKVLPEGSQRSDVDKIGIKVTKIVKRGGGKTDIIKRIEHDVHDFLVIGIENKKEFPHFFGHDLGEYIAQNYFRQTTLYVPAKGRPFIDPIDGRVVLKTVVIPVAESPSPQNSIDVLHRLLKIFPDARPKVIGIHAGTAFPYISPSLLDGLDWCEQLSDKPVVSAIQAAATENRADLVIMATNGRDSFSQRLIGSNTEKVLKTVTCPILTVPVIK